MTVAGRLRCAPAPFRLSARYGPYSQQGKIVADTALRLLEQWRAGSQEAARQLFHLYVGRLTALARSRLSPKLARRFDAEDVVQSAYRSFFAAARGNAYDLKHGGDLWQLLVAITLHKLQNKVHHHKAKKRAFGAERSFGSEDSLLGINAQRLAQGPSPGEAVALVDELEHIMKSLEPVPRRVLELRLQGYGHYEIATQVGRSVPTVRRILDRCKARLTSSQGDSSLG